MAKINMIDPTVKLIDKTIEQRQEQGQRGHLGGSLIGDPCERKLWYQFRWALKENFSGRMLRLFQRGHDEEARFVEYLKMVGVEVHEVDPSTGKQFNFKAANGHFGASLDGVALGIGTSKKWHLLEFKTHNEKSFSELIKKGVEQAKPLHYAQMQVYMHLAELERAYYMAVNKNTDELHAERIKYDKPFAQDLIKKAERIINADTPPPRLSSKPEYYLCKFCLFSNICHYSAIPQANCRTCAHASPIADGKWHCLKDQSQISDQRGCDKHLFVPQMINAEVIDASDDHVEYDSFINGKGGFASIELAKLGEIKRIDESMKAMKDMGFRVEAVSEKDNPLAE